MTEKIKIYVTPRIAEVLEKDAEAFEFYKTDGRTPNKNALLTKIVLNYLKNFDAEQKELYAYLHKKIGGLGRISEPQLDGVCLELTEKFNERSAASDGGKFIKPVSLKPTRETESLIDYAERYLLCGRTISEYFRSMFAAYADLPQDRREEIIFKPQYNAIMKAIAERKRIFITLKSKRSLETAVYTIARSKEEMHSYALTATPSGCAPIRLSRIVSVTQLAESAVFSEKQIALFGRMIQYGPQFFYKADEEPVKVLLSDGGLEMFRQYYVHRPAPVSIEGNVMTFNCSHSQILQYFRRFGRQAKILSPESVKVRMYEFHRSAANGYNND